MDSYKNPKPTVDIVIFMNGNLDRDNRVVLIKRKNPPHGWALPGGFVNEGESYEAAAVRETLEETGLRVKLMEQFHTYSDPLRDPRQHNTSTVYLAVPLPLEQLPAAADDAQELRMFTIPEILDGSAELDLAFDHKTILTDVLWYLQSEERPFP